MYTIYQIENNKCVIIKKITPNLRNVWIKAESPTDSELDELRQLLPISEEDIKDTLDINEVPKLEKNDDSFFLLLQTPVRNINQGEETLPTDYVVRPLSIFFNDRLVVTIVWGHNDITSYVEEKLANIAKNHLIDTSKTEQFVVKLFLFTAKTYLRYLKEIHLNLRVPVTTRHAEFDRQIIALLKIEESLVYFNASLRSNYILIEKISKRIQSPMSAELQELLEDADSETLQAVEVGKVYGRIVEDLRTALSSLISNTLSRKVNWLTRITLVLMVPPIIATFYGMNVGLPLENHPYAFWLILVATIVLTTVGILWLRKHEVE